MSKQKRTPHSEFFVNVIGRRENALELLKQVLPEGIQRHLVLDSLNIEKGSYVDEKLHDHFSDLIFSVKLKNGKVGRIYCLLKHKSAPEYLVALQLLSFTPLNFFHLTGVHGPGMERNAQAGKDLWKQTATNYTDCCLSG